jgi:Calx-beta domain
VIQFSAASYSINEGAGTVTITVTRTGSATGSASVQFATADGSATSPADYTAMSGILTFAPGEQAKSFSVFVTDDAVKESSKSFNVVLSNPANATLGSPASATVSIADNDKRTGKPRIATPRKRVLS